REIILTMHDVTELKNLETRVRQSERLAALGTLAAGLAHEIRNPLSAIKTFVQLLPRKKDKPEFLAKFDRTVPREITRINSLVEDLLVLSRIPKYRFENASLPILLRDILELHERTIAAQKIVVSCEFDDSLPSVWGDPDQLVKALQNLIQNSIQAMADGGELCIRAFFSRRYPTDQKPPGSGWVVLIFEDTGTGIGDADLKNIFNPFFTTKETGTGLGLAITHKVISEHKGTIRAENRNGPGARFILALPTGSNRMDV
ncbi:MAG: two-component system sensor histidine kinase NtrB, partial [Desulfovibrionales bacterium]